jgi:hypothetical protein
LEERAAGNWTKCAHTSPDIELVKINELVKIKELVKINAN